MATQHKLISLLKQADNTFTEQDRLPKHVADVRRFVRTADRTTKDLLVTAVQLGERLADGFLRNAATISTTIAGDCLYTNDGRRKGANKTSERSLNQRRGLHARIEEYMTDGDMSYTKAVAQLADELGLSADTVRKRTANPGTKTRTRNVKERTVAPASRGSLVRLREMIEHEGTIAKKFLCDERIETLLQSIDEHFDHMDEKVAGAMLSAIEIGRFIRGGVLTECGGADWYPAGSDYAKSLKARQKGGKRTREKYAKKYADWQVKIDQYCTQYRWSYDQAAKELARDQGVHFGTIKRHTKNPKSRQRR